MTVAPYPFTTESPSANALRSWYQSLDETDRGGRAALRRAASLEEVHFLPTLHRLRKELPRELRYRDNQLAALAALCAHVKEDVPTAEDKQERSPLGSSMAQPKERPRVSVLRFRRLLECETVEQLFRPMVRALKLLNGRADILELARLVYWWEQGSVRRALAKAYYSALPPEKN